MAAYLSIRQHPSTTIVPQENIAVSVSDAGDVRGVAGPPEVVADISLFHLDMSPTDKQAVETFYSQSQDATFTFTYAGDDTVYNSVFVQEPTYTWVDYESWDITVNLLGIQQ